MSLPPLPDELARFTPTEGEHRALQMFVREYGQACRAAALEEAAQICDRDWSCDTSSYETYAEVNKCAKAIRSLKS